MDAGCATRRDGHQSPTTFFSVTDECLIIIIMPYSGVSEYTSIVRPKMVYKVGRLWVSGQGPEWK